MYVQRNINAFSATSARRARDRQRGGAGPSAPGPRRASVPDGAVRRFGACVDDVVRSSNFHAGAQRFARARAIADGCKFA
jgi:hypothetical protein